MDLSDKRFHELEELIKTRKSFHEWIREGKVQTQLFNQQIEKTSVPFLANVVKKEDEIIDKLKSKETPTVDSIDDSFDPPSEYGDFYSEFAPLTIEFKARNIDQTIAMPKLNLVKLYGHTFNGVEINKTFFIFYTVNGVDTIQLKSEHDKRFPLTKGLIHLLELKGLLKIPKRLATKQDLDNYMEIMKLAGIGPTNDTYVAGLANQDMGSGKKIGKGFDDGDTDEELSSNPIELFAELRKLLAAKVSGHNNVYNSVVSILKKLMNMGEITEEKHDKILHKYF